MCNGRPLFPGNSDRNQLERIFMQLGLPDEDDYPGIIELPEWAAAKARMKEKAQQGGFSLKRPANLQHLVKPMTDPLGVDLLTQMLQYDPAKRIAARTAMDHPYFLTLNDSMRQGI